LGGGYVLCSQYYFEQPGTELREAVARFVVANAGGQLVDSLTALGMTRPVKQHALQRLNDRNVFLLLHDVCAVHALAAQVRVAVVVLVGVDAVGAVGADFVHDAADAHDPVGVVVHFQDEHRRLIRDVGLDGHGRLVNAGVIRISGKPRGALGPSFIVVPRDADGECRYRVFIWIWMWHRGSEPLHRTRFFIFNFSILSLVNSEHGSRIMKYQKYIRS